MKKIKFTKLHQILRQKKRKELYMLIIIFAASFFLTLYISPQLKNKIAAEKKPALSEEKINSFAKSITLACQNSSNWRNCYATQLGSLNSEIEFTDTLKVLQQVSKIDSKTNECHIISHKIASSEVEKDPQNWLSMFKYVNQNTCVSGFVHGAFEGKKRLENNFELTKETIPKICDQLIKITKNNDVDACGHVIGHILLADNYGDIKKTTEICNSLENNIIKNACNNGTFMENITRDNLAIHEDISRLPFNEQSALQVEQTCRQYSGISETSCWRELSHIYAPASHNDFKKIYQFCSHALNDNNRDECYLHSFNSIVAGPEYDPTQNSIICAPFMGTNKMDRCLDWAIHLMVFSSTNLTPRAMSFCEQFNDRNVEQRCFSILGKELSKVTTSDKQNQLCQNAPDQYKNQCTCPTCNRSASPSKDFFSD